MADGDGTYDPTDADAVLEPILSGRAEHVIGDRFYRMEAGAMPKLNQIGNSLVNRAFAFVHGRNLVDILSGYRAFTKESFNRLRVRSDGFGIETEMAVECVKHGVPTEVVGVSYRSRPAGSETNLHPVKDGARIYLTLFKLAKTSNPLFYFGSVGTLSLLAGLIVGAYVGYRYFFVGISHEALAVVSAAGILLGVQLLMFGVLSDVIVAVNREQTRRIEELAKTLSARNEGAAQYRPAGRPREYSRGDDEPDETVEAEAGDD
jgi:dolichol-phosphate mannosyltransferase